MVTSWKFDAFPPNICKVNPTLPLVQALRSLCRLALNSSLSLNLVVCPIGNISPKTRIIFLAHSLHSNEPSDDFKLSTLCLSVGLVHSFHRSSSYFLKSISFTEELPTSAQCIHVDILSLEFLETLVP
jgi:hypothetical protein